MKLWINQFEFVCNNCKPPKCVQCYSIDKDAINCFICGERTCHACIGDKFSSKMRYYCSKCQCSECGKPAKMDCESHACKQHCDRDVCKAHKKRGGGGDKTERDESSLSFDRDQLTQVTIRLLTIEEKIAETENSPKVKESEELFRKVAVNASLSVCIGYLTAWKLEHLKEKEELEKLNEEKNRLKEMQKQEFKKIKL
jgi:hypothetical protein